jgi:uncharacterized SAM-binding protein YcdF (DUF218 family)
VSRTDRKARRRPSWRAALPLLLLAGLAFGFARFRDAASAAAAPGGRTDAVVVLTGGAERVETALRLLEDGAAPRLLVSGAAAGLTLAELARAHGRDPAALAGRVTLGHAAATTAGNAAETAAFARARGLRSLRVVTAGYHMPRALLELRRALPEAELVPHPVQPSALRDGTVPAWRAWTLLPGEYLKYLAALAGATRLLPARTSPSR